MSSYRLYCLDGAGKIGLADWLEAEDDDDAIEKARNLKSHVLKCEVWQGARLVKSFDAQELSAQ